jgi:thymidylate synthase
MNTLDKQYTDLLQDILDNGVKKETRNGGTLSVFGRQIRHKMSDGFPLLTTKKMAWKSIVTELLWFLQGRTDLRWLLEQGNTIWVGDCYANYLKKRDRFSNKDNVKEDVVINGMNGSSNRPLTQEEFINKIKTDDEFAKKWGELGPVYGKQWRDWGSKRVSKRFYDKKIPYSKFVQEGGIDQIANLINDLKTNPDSRRLMVNAWNVGELDEMVLPPCHFSWQVYTRELSLEERELYAITKYPKLNEEPLGALVDRQSFSHDFGDSLNIPTRAISLMFNMRSCDTFLGLPFNIASYGLLLEIIAKEVNMVPDELIGNLGDVHLYSNHIEQAKEQIGREPYPLPKLLFKDHLKSFDTIIDILRVQDFILDNYQSHPSIKAPLSN